MKQDQQEDIIGDYHLLGVAALMTLLSFLWQQGFFDHMC